MTLYESLSLSLYIYIHTHTYLVDKVVEGGDLVHVHGGLHLPGVAVLLPGVLQLLLQLGLLEGEVGPLDAVAAGEVLLLQHGLRPHEVEAIYIYIYIHIHTYICNISLSLSLSLYIFTYIYIYIYMWACSCGP